MSLEILFAISLVLIIILIYLYRKALIRINELKFSKQSLSTKYGKMTEQFIPFMKDYPYDEQNFRFLGTPIDGVQFEGDRIVFLEFKVGDSKLTMKQRKIRDLVDKKKVHFEEFRISE